jgi:hypothetical protein
MELLGGEGGIARFAEGQILGEAIEGYNEEQRLIQSTPACDVQDSIVVMVWSDNSSGTNQIWSKSSTDSGATFGDSVQISDSPIAAIQPDVAINEDGVHVVWLDFQLDDPEVEDDYDSWHLFYKRDSDFDNQFEDSTFIDLNVNVLEETRDDIAWSIWEPSIVAEGEAGMILVSVEPAVVGAIFSFNGGNSWTEGIRVRGECKFPVNVNGCTLDGSAGVTWCDQSEIAGVNKDWEVYYASSSNVLNHDWTIYRKLSNDSEYSIQPTIDSDDSAKVYVAWADMEGGIFNIFFRKSPNGGLFWNLRAIPGPVAGSGGAWHPDLAFDRTTPGEAHLVWVQSDGGDGMLYYNHYNGTSWGTAGAASIPTPDGSVNRPDYAIDDGGNTFVVYTDVTESSSIVKGDQDPSN